MPFDDDAIVVAGVATLRLAISRPPFDLPSASLRLPDSSLRTFDVIGWFAMSEPFGSPQASWKASRMVRKKGLEPSRPCGRQPLKRLIAKS